jgi:hypothetical protein
MLIICSLLCITCILILITLYYEVYKPTWDARNAAKNGGKYATAEEIDALLYEADAFNATEISGQLNTDALRN